MQERESERKPQRSLTRNDLKATNDENMAGIYGLSREAVRVKVKVSVLFKSNCESHTFVAVQKHSGFYFVFGHFDVCINNCTQKLVIFAITTSASKQD